MTLTTTQLSEMLGADRENTYTLVRFLEAQGIITCVGQAEPAEKKRGKRQYLYEFKPGTVDAIKALLTSHSP